MSVNSVEPSPIRTLVVDDHRAFAEAVVARLGVERHLEIVGVAFSTEHALTLLQTTDPDLLLLDLTLGDRSGLEVLRWVATMSRPPAVVIMSGTTSPHDVLAGLHGGALAWVPKDCSVDELLAAISDALRGDVWLSQPLVGPVIRELLRGSTSATREPSFIDELTPRQAEVLGHLLAGTGRIEIAKRMAVSVNTVRTHIQQLLLKADVHSTLALVALARDLGPAPEVSWRGQPRT